VSVLTCDFNDTGVAFTTVGGSPIPPCRAEAELVLVERNAVVRACCFEHGGLARDEHPEASEYAVMAVDRAA
jgi:hypothetical protein